MFLIPFSEQQKENLLRNLEVVMRIFGIRMILIKVFSMF